MDSPDSSTAANGVDRAAVVQTCRVLLRPIASLLLKCGMTWREFAEVSKSVFVAVASQDFGLNGRPTNVSRVSILTGVSRKEIARVRALLEQESDPSAQQDHGCHARPVGVASGSGLSDSQWRTERAPGRRRGCQLQHPLAALWWRRARDQHAQGT
jgi:hypothetical protein